MNRHVRAFKAMAGGACSHFSQFDRTQCRKHEDQTSFHIIVTLEYRMQVLSKGGSMKSFKTSQVEYSKSIFISVTCSTSKMTKLKYLAPDRF